MGTINLENNEGIEGERVNKIKGPGRYIKRLL